MITRRRVMDGFAGAAFVLGWVRRFGDTADLNGDDRGDTRFVAGVQVWF